MIFSWDKSINPACSFFAVVFMGSEKYPDENAFDSFIKRHGGSDNASTDCERVNQRVTCSHIP